MLENKIPVTRQNYLESAYPPDEIPEELSAEMEAPLPSLLSDPRLQELDPSETYYEELVNLVANNPELIVPETRTMLEAVG